MLKDLSFRNSFFKQESFIFSESTFIIYCFISICFDGVFSQTKIIGAVMQLIIPAWGVLLTIKNRKKMDFLCWLTIVFCALGFMIEAFHKDITSTWGFFTRLWCITTVIITSDEVHQRRMFKSVLLVIILTSLFVDVFTFLSFPISKSPWIMNSLPEYLFKVIEKGTHIGGGRWSGFLGNANTTAHSASLGICASIFYVSMYKQKYVLCIFTSILSSVVVMLSQSRGNILLLAGFCCLYILFLVLFNIGLIKKMDKKKLIIISSCLVSFCIVILLFFLVVPYGQAIICKLARMPYRDFSSPIELLQELLITMKHGSGRDFLIQDNLEKFRGNELFGLSTSQLSDNKASMMVHNGYLLALFTMGIPLCLLFIFMLIVFLWPSIRAIRKRDKMSKAENNILSLLFAIAIMALVNNNVEVFLLYHHIIQCSFFFFIFTFIYVIGKKDGRCKFLLDE